MSNRRGRGRQVNRNEVADLFGVALTTIDDWVRRGCPVITRGSRGKSWAFNSADVSEWREQRARLEAQGVELASKKDLELRRLAAETGKVELELARLRGEIAPVQQFEQAMTKAFAELRGKMRQIPNRAAPRVVGQVDDRKIKQILLEEIDLALLALAEDRLLDEDDLEDDAEDEDA